MTCEKHGGGTGSIFCKFCDAEQVDAHEAKLAAKPDVAGLVERLQKQSVCIHIAAEPECAKDVSDGLRKAADALLSLSAQLAEKEAECEGLQGKLTATQDVLDYLHGLTTDKVMGLQQDAERYRWVRSPENAWPSVELPGGNGFQGLSDEKADAAIDSARKEST